MNIELKLGNITFGQGESAVKAEDVNIKIDGIEYDELVDLVYLIQDGGEPVDLEEEFELEEDGQVAWNPFEEFAKLKQEQAESEQKKQDTPDVAQMFKELQEELPFLKVVQFPIKLTPEQMQEQSNDSHVSHLTDLLDKLMKEGNFKL